MNRQQPRNLAKQGKYAGFTLLEIMVVITVVGILASIAYSSYTQYLTRSRRAEAFAALQQFSNALEQRFTIDAAYLPATGVNFVTPPANVFNATVPLDGGGNPYYNLTVRSTTNTTFTVRATPIGVQAGDGIIELDHNMNKRWDENNSGCPTDNVCTADVGESDWKKN